MLHPETVKPLAFSILKQLMEIPELKDFSLVGGTALSLTYGHRKSVDLDLFSNQPFENTVIIAALKKSFRINLLWKKNHPALAFFVILKKLKLTSFVIRIR
jgi:hypothetical protein